MVDPQDVGDDGGVLRAGPVARHEHRRSASDGWTGAVPDAFAGQRPGEHRFDRWRRVGDLLGVPDKRPHRAEPDGAQALEPGAALAGRARCVVLGRVDDPVAEGHVVAHPLGGALGEVLARRLEHVVRVGDPEVEGHEHQRSQRREKGSPPAKPPPRIRTARAEFTTVKHRAAPMARSPVVACPAARVCLGSSSDWAPTMRAETNRAGGGR